MDAAKIMEPGLELFQSFGFTPESDAGLRHEFGQSLGGEAYFTESVDRDFGGVDQDFLELIDEELDEGVFKVFDDGVAHFVNFIFFGAARDFLVGLLDPDFHGGCEFFLKGVAGLDFLLAEVLGFLIVSGDDGSENCLFVGVNEIKCWSGNTRGFREI